jgi:DNA primase
LIKRITVDEILSTARVEDVVEDYVNLRRRGNSLIGLCPFHNEKTPSFNVSPTKNIYKCFGCGKGGDAVNFLMEHEQFSYPEALKFLAQKYNIEIEEEERTDEQREQQQKKDSLLLINEMASKYFIDQLNDTEEGKAIGLSYFRHRGLLDVTIQAFSLGYSSRAYEAFKSYAKSKDYNIELLQQLGLISQSGKDFFRERVIFPFHNLSGKVIGFGGRILKDNIKAPKYLNSPETALYNKRKTLYGLYQAKSEIRKTNTCVLVEGYTDVLSLHQNEVRNAVASSGTSLTPDQVSLIKRFADNVIVLYDGDAAGQKAALRGLNIFLEHNVNVKVVLLPEGHDPDSYVKELGSTEFKTYLENEGQDFIIMLATDIEKQYGKDPVQKSVQIKELITSLALIGDQIKRQLYVKQCADILHIEESSLIHAINQGIRTQIKKASIKRNNYNPQQDQYTPPQAHIDYDPNKDHSQGIHEVHKEIIDYQERDVMRVLITDGEKIFDEEENISIGQHIISSIADIVDMITNPAHKAIVEEYKVSLGVGVQPTKATWLQHPDQAVRGLTVSFLSQNYTYANWEEKGLLLQTQKPIDENYVKDSNQALLRFKLKKIKERVKQLQEMFAQQTDSQKDIVLLTAYQTLINERQSIANELNTIVM